MALYCIAWPGSARSLDSFARSTSIRVGYLKRCQHIFRGLNYADTIALDQSHPRNAMVWKASGKLGWHDRPVSPGAYCLTYRQTLLVSSLRICRFSRKVTIPCSFCRNTFVSTTGRLIHRLQLSASKAKIGGTGFPCLSRSGTGGSWQKSPHSTS